MNVCPHCKGDKEFSVQVSEYWEEHTRYRVDPCGTCRGTGTVSDLQLGIYKARGGPAPLPMRRF